MNLHTWVAPPFAVFEGWEMALTSTEFAGQDDLTPGMFMHHCPGRHYAFGEAGLVLVNEARLAVVKVTGRAAAITGKTLLLSTPASHPSNPAKGGATQI
jgi:hypothetical protein